MGTRFLRICSRQELQILSCIQKVKCDYQITSSPVDRPSPLPPPGGTVHLQPLFYGALGFPSFANPHPSGGGGRANRGETQSRGRGVFQFVFNKMVFAQLSQRFCTSCILFGGLPPHRPSGSYFFLWSFLLLRHLYLYVFASGS